ncbi:MAG: haloacid dehalogenase, partial [Candidatus Thiodiazotropha sp. (ex Lucinoma annulata)]|nr:haloacid dehalogenase [Candidatus Thiodiazotropha sp. (ex Lucinoma annulata)]
PKFWYRLQNLHPFDKRRTLFVDDSLSVLKSAREYGIHWLLAMLKPDSKEPAREVGDYPAIHDFTEITQGLRCTI